MLCSNVVAKLDKESGQQKVSAPYSPLLQKDRKSSAGETDLTYSCHAPVTHTHAPTTKVADRHAT